MKRFSPVFFEQSVALTASGRRRPQKVVIYQNEQCPIFNYFATLRAPTTRTTMARALYAVAHHLGQASIYDIEWQKFSHTKLAVLINRLDAAGLSPHTVRLYVCAVKQVAKQAYFLGLMSDKQYLQLSDVSASGGSRVRDYTLLDKSQTDHLLREIAEKNSIHAFKLRDTAIFSVLLGCGLRRAEVVGLRRDCVTRTHIKVIGKGNKERTIALHPSVSTALAQWIAALPDEAPWVFTRIRRNGLISSLPLSDSMIFKLTRKYATVPPHSLRRSFATRLYQAGANINDLARILGHSKTATTEIYVLSSQQRQDDTILTYY
ncbi:tyrosine-type recombinase/integrase [Pseudoalteromonas rubra]|uniref:Tyr recombinase domain-containing protein n=1 Tax=Pseudoalteromonas rubra TaxID=43658 RepID=A0A0U3IEB1_9GAMM|nr:tyrosine-type recombinase/integrase [Pseudoalteromonas rubra]ALU46128.1 hypothetical protein AT705_24510 [Pseudoalteromonas rubra]